VKTVNLLCKGRSLTHLEKLGDSEFVVLANDFDREISQVNGLSEYLKNKEIHICLNMVSGYNGYNEIDFFNRFNVTKLIRPYPYGIREAGTSGQNIPLEENFLGEHHKEFMYKNRKYAYDYTGTGMASFAYTMLDCSVDVINLIGMDFYDNLNYGVQNYLVDCREGGDFTKDPWTIEEMQQNFCKLVKSNPKIQVNMITTCKNFIDEFKFIKNLNVTIIDGNEKKILEKEKMKKIAIISCGWHYPYHLFEQLSKLKLPVGWEAEKFVVGHRDPDLDVVKKEKRNILDSVTDKDNILVKIDEKMYKRTANREDFDNLGFKFSLEENKIGDFYYFNQWAEKNNWEEYDLFFFMHDDTFLLGDSIIVDVIEKKCDLWWKGHDNGSVTSTSKDTDWLFLTGTGDQLLCPRGSFAFFDKELIKYMNGQFPMDNIYYTRSGMNESPGYPAKAFDGVETKLSEDVHNTEQSKDLHSAIDYGTINRRGGLGEWNQVAYNFSGMMQKNNWVEKMTRLSPYFRVSQYCVEGERGLCHLSKVSSDSYVAGINDYVDKIMEELS